MTVNENCNDSERELRPTATYRKVTGGFRSQWGAELFANIPQWSVPRRVVELMPITPFATYCATRRCYNRVEQLPANKFAEN
jgi:hypothetical protein